MDITAAKLAEATAGQLVGLDPTTQLTAVSVDSRTCQAGSLFVALTGERTDGHQYVAAARQAGATLALVSRPVAGAYLLVPDVVTALGQIARHYLACLRKTANKPLVLAVTGSVGKTSTKDLLGKLMASQGNTVAAQASYNNHLGLPRTVLAANRTTDYLVLEMGANHRGEIAYLTKIAPPNIGVVLGIGTAHVGEFGSIQAIAQTKGELLAALPPTGWAVRNADDPRVSALPSPAQSLSFGFHAAADIQIAPIIEQSTGYLHVRLTDQSCQRSVEIATRLIGKHHAHNLAAAVAAAKAGGVGLEQAAEQLTGVGPSSPHRMALRHTPAGSLLIDDAYNANPDSVAAALVALRQQADQHGWPAVAVLGEMRELGEQAPKKHQEIGHLAVELGIDRLIGIGELGKSYLDGAQAAGGSAKQLDWFATPRQAASLLAALTATVILVKGSLTTQLWCLADDLAES
ncbi:MAG: UDP-N-acetylmuramoyl-tripeptide--D-alanyl-D-alanine ligase [Bifidobacteriaceae bacterium]|jgi:UDP-N-acetylmuramoyl-tripeptide--D-alanyl-D-alanine ligase|nr:UDP-N-acetylmuramoyl-tripeptide--D-alanyl-D-alanine ligase [Bifidobacteriaceae bacterium]